MVAFRFQLVLVIHLLLCGLGNSQDLKSQLKRITADNFQVPQGKSAYEISLKMLDQIGSTDSELRDNLIYTILANWIGSGKFTDDELRKIAAVCTSDTHLFFHIDEGESDFVFKRTFSVLILAELVSSHLKSPYLSKADVKGINQKTIHYLQKEKDLRGYVADGGWAHSVAHSADLLNQLVRCDELGAEDLTNILDAILNKMTVKKTVYVYGEDWRMAKVIITMLKYNLVAKEQIVAWIKRFEKEILYKPLQSVNEIVGRYMNVKNFLLNIHLRTLKEELSVNISAELFETIKTITNRSEN